MLKTSVTGETMIFAKEFTTSTGDYKRMRYRASIGKKDKEGEWDNGFIDVQFKKGVKIPDRSKIDIRNGWLTFWKNSQGFPVWYIFVNEFDFVDGENAEPQAAFAEVDEDIPF